VTLVEKATQDIRKMIADRKVDENGYLPSEGELSEQLGVSRMTIREAVRSLEVRGFVKRVHGKGILVTENSAETLRQTMADAIFMSGCTLLDLIEVRTAVEAEAAFHAAKRATEQDLAEMLSYIEKMEAAETMDDKYIEADLGFHLALVRASKNPILLIIEQAYTPLLRDTITSASQGPEVIERAYHYHRNIYDAIVAKDGQKAEANMQTHLVVTQSNIKERYLQEESA